MAQQSRPLTISPAVLAGVALAAFMLASPLRADEAQSATDQSTEAAASAESGTRVYELHGDDPNSPPVNYRSNQDPRYDTPAQHDAEMYAEQYERERQQQEIEEKKRLDNLNSFSAGAQYQPRSDVTDSNYR